MYKAAQLDDNDIAVGISELRERFTHPKLVWIDGFNTDVMGKRYNRSTRKFEDVAPEPVAPPTKEKLYSDLSAYRSQRELAGVEVQGIIIKTDEGSIAKLVGTLMAFQQGMVASVNWKGSNGWLNNADANTLNAIAAGITGHVQACFTAERDVADHIAGLTEGQLADFNLPAVWQSVGGP